MALCYDITAMRDGFKGADIPRFLDIGKRTIFV